MSKGGWSRALNPKKTKTFLKTWFSRKEGIFPVVKKNQRLNGISLVPVASGFIGHEKGGKPPLWWTCVSRGKFGRYGHRGHWRLLEFSPKQQNGGGLKKRGGTFQGGNSEKCSKKRPIFFGCPSKKVLPRPNQEMHLVFRALGGNLVKTAICGGGGTPQKNGGPIF